MLAVNVGLGHLTFSTELLECHQLLHVLAVELYQIQFDSERLESCLCLSARRAIAIHREHENLMFLSQFSEFFFHGFDLFLVNLLFCGSGWHIVRALCHHSDKRNFLGSVMGQTGFEFESVRR